MVENRLADPIGALVRDKVTHAESERTFQILDLMKNERFWRGHHYALPVERNGLWQWGTIDATIPGVEKPYDYVLNYYYGDGMKLIGLLGKMPNAKCVPDERNDVNSRRARIGDQVLSNIWSQWNTETITAELMLSLWKNGTTFGYTPFVPNGRRFGKTRVPARIEKREIQISDPEFRCFHCGQVTPEQAGTMTGMCPSCGNAFTPEMLFPAEFAEVPEVVDYHEFANGTVEFHLCSAYTVTTPFWLKSLDESPWLQYEYEEHSGRILRTFPELRDMPGVVTSYGNGGGRSGDYAAQARNLAQSPYLGNYTSQRDMVRFTRFWMEPDMYEILDGSDKATRDKLYVDYPDGLRVTLVNGTVVHLFPESHREVWAACKPTVGEYLYTQPLGNPYREMNRLINNAHNIMVQTAERGIPIQIFDSRLLKPEALKKNPAAVMDWLGVIPPAGGRLQDSLWHSPSVELSSSVVQMAATSLDAARQSTNVVPQLFGQHGGGEKTLGQVEIERNQALLPHNTTWNFIRQFMGRCYENAIRQYVKHSPGDLLFATPSMRQPKRLQVENAVDLLDGGWHVEVEENIPLTHGQKRAQIWQLLELPPEVVDRIGLFTPANLSAIYDAISNSDLEVPGMNGREKALAVIAELLEGQPMQVETGDPYMPVKMLPSIPADEFEDDHMLMATVVKEWSQTETGRAHQRKNRRGYMNVIAWGMAHLEMANAALAPPGVPAGPGGAGVEQPPGLEQSGPGAPPPPGMPELGPAPPPPQPEEMPAVGLEGV